MTERMIDKPKYHLFHVAYANAERMSGRPSKQSRASYEEGEIRDKRSPSTDAPSVRCSARTFAKSFDTPLCGTQGERIRRSPSTDAADAAAQGKRRDTFLLTSLAQMFYTTPAWNPHVRGGAAEVKGLPPRPGAASEAEGRGGVDVVGGMGLRFGCGA